MRFHGARSWLEDEPVNWRCVEILFIDDLGAFPGMFDLPKWASYENPEMISWTPVGNWKKRNQYLRCFTMSVGKTSLPQKKINGDRMQKMGPKKYLYVGL